MGVLEELKELYNKTSKHSNYQILPRSLSILPPKNEIQVQTRFEKERLDYILSRVDVKHKNILDIGGNTGYFTFELIENGADQVDYFEGNKDHAKFVEMAARYLGLENKINVINQYYEFLEEDKSTYDIILLLNVLHHVGDDYGDASLSMEEAKKEMMFQLNSLAKKTDILVFQMGFNWKGNENFCLFANGTKKEMIDFIENNTKNNWKIKSIGIPQMENGKIVYKDLNNVNIQRFDHLGEFLNRPIFIMETLKG